jgi:nucleotide-binding universal stress UspA family protein
LPYRDFGIGRTRITWGQKAATMKQKKSIVATTRKRTQSSNRPRPGGHDGGADRRDTFRLLIVIDASDASKRVLRYIGRILGRRDRVEFHLAYVTPHMPAEFLESGGSELPEREQEIESELRAEQNRWMAVNDTAADRVLRKARTALLRAGATADRVHSCASSPLDARTVADEVLVLARDQKCGTVVVGHRAHTWFRGLGQSHLAEQLVRRAEGYAVWVVD